MEKYSIYNIHWSYEDVIKKDGKIIDIIKGSNIVVDDCSKLIAGLIGGKISKGVAYWAIGSGNPSWDDLWGVNDPKPDKSDKLLLNEIARKSISPANISYVDEQGVNTETLTNRIKIEVMFNENEANGDWREFGIFGGNTAVATANTGILIDRKLHKPIFKTSDVTITRSIIFEF